ncbi:MAG: hypothetical protein ABFD64_06895 [Armatimonadota bacterium]
MSEYQEKPDLPIQLLAAIVIAANVLVVVMFIRRRYLEKNSKFPFAIIAASLAVQDIALFTSKTAFVYLQAFALYLLFFGMLINIFIGRNKQD